MGQFRQNFYGLRKYLFFFSGYKVDPPLQKMVKMDAKGEIFEKIYVPMLGSSRIFWV